MKISFKKAFIKSRDKLPVPIQHKLSLRLMDFESNPLSQILNNHALRGEYSGYRSINITGDYRAIFREYPEGTYEFVDFILIGSHSHLYT